MKTMTVEKTNGISKFYMPYMTLETLDRLKETGTIKDTGYYSMFEYEGPLTLELFDRHYSIAI